MASVNFLIVNATNSRQRFVSSDETVDFLSIKVGASALEIKETAGAFDFDAKVLSNLADPVADQDAATKKHVSDTYIPLTQKAANSGVATLDSGGKIPASQLPNSVMEYQGSWSPATNVPELLNTGMDPAPTAGDVYRASEAGTVDFGAGEISFVVGDYAIFNGTVWELSRSGADAVHSVNGQAGIVSLDSDDILEGTTNKYYTATQARTDLIETTEISETDEDKAPCSKLVFEGLEEKADAVEEYASLLPVERALETKLKNINDALQKMKEDSYGKCEKCNKDISYEELSITPETKNCQECRT
jgi:RNA polymerase-binding transcription factor DksA